MWLISGSFKDLSFQDNAESEGEGGDAPGAEDNIDRNFSQESGE